MNTSSASYNSLPILSGVFVAILLISSITSTKLIDIGGFTLDGGTVLFPFSYIFWDILTEVYGYKNTRKVIWTGLFSLILFSLLILVIGMLPANPEWWNQNAYDAILGATPRIVLASVIAFFIGEFTNSYILARMKVWMNGKKLYLRTLASSIVGNGLDTVIFILIAFWGIFDTEIILALIFGNFFWKIGTEILFTPITYKVVSYLKKKDGIDVYDYDTRFNPFSWK
jgi:queuosine precursor transporter